MVISVHGEGLQGLYNEAGGHRVQRVPPTEKRGRVHTSTVTVAIMAEKDVCHLEINIDDIEISWFSGTGPGGQNRNKVMASCRLLHRPTGISSVSQTRSRRSSFDQALEHLKRKIRNVEESRHSLIEKTARKSQVGSGQRGDKIRTIQFQNDSAVDHRTNRRITSEQYLRGYMDKLWPVDK